MTAGGPGPALPFPHLAHTLDNGLEVIVVPTPADGLVTLHSVVRAGSRDEVAEGESGFAHLVEHMMFRGSERFPGREYDRTLTRLGADSNAYTGEDATCYHVSLATEDLERVTELEADRFLNLCYREETLRTEAGAVAGEHRKARSDPHWVLFEALRAAAFDVHPYRHTVLGLEADIAAMPTRWPQSRAFHERLYRPDNTVLVVTGDLRPSAVVGLAEASFRDWRPGHRASHVPAEPEQSQPRRVDVGFPGRALPLLAVAWKGTAFDPADRDGVAGLMLGELVFGSSSDLYRQLVVERRVVQSLEVDFVPSHDPGLWTVTASLASIDDVAEVEEIFDAAVGRLGQHGVGGGEAERVGSHVRQRLLLGLDSPDGVAETLAGFVSLGHGVAAVDAYLNAVAMIRADDLQRAARRFLVPERRTTAILTGEA